MKQVNFMLIMWSMITIASFTSEDNWTETGGATSMTGQDSGDRAGWSVAISSDGTMVAVGERGWPNVNNNGRVRTYLLQDGIWTETGGAISMTGQVAGDQAGYSVAINSDGSMVAVGESAWNGVGDNFPSSGRVRTYVLQNGIWTQTGGATSITGQNTGDRAGWSVAMSSDGTSVAVGEPFWSGAGQNAGRVRTYILQNGTWTQTGGATSMTGDTGSSNAGSSVAMSLDGMTVAVGERAWSGERGRVRSYKLQNGVWTQTGGATSMTGQVAGDAAGWSVDMSSDGSMIAVGEINWSGQRGRASVYKLLNGVWTQVGGAASMMGENVDDQAGYSVAISADGTRVAVGERNWSGGSLNGRVRAYSLENGTWTLKGSPTAMTGVVANDQAGYSVAMSADGNTIAVGEVGWSGTENNGRVRVYQYPNIVVNFILNPNYIANQELAQTSYSEISQSTLPGNATQPGGIGQGAVFTAYRIMVQGK